MRIEVDSGNLDSLQEAIEKLELTLAEGVDTDSLISASEELITQAKVIIDCAEDTSDYKRPGEAEDTAGCVRFHAITEEEVRKRFPGAIEKLLEDGDSGLVSLERWSTVIAEVDALIFESDTPSDAVVWNAESGRWEEES